MSSVTDVRFRASRRDLADSGLLAWASFRLAGVRFLDIGLRRTLEGQYVLSWPRSRTGRGRDHCCVYPADDASREALKAQIVAEAKRQGVIP